MDAPEDSEEVALLRTTPALLLTTGYLLSLERAENVYMLPHGARRDTRARNDMPKGVDIVDPAVTEDPRVAHLLRREGVRVLDTADLIERQMLPFFDKCWSVRETPVEGDAPSRPYDDNFGPYLTYLRDNADADTLARLRETLVLRCGGACGGQGVWASGGLRGGC